MVSIHFQLIIALVGLQGVLATLEYRPHVSNLAPWPCEVAATSTVRNPKWCPIDNLKKNHGKLSMNQGYLKISVDHTIGNKLVSLWVGFRIICLCFLMCYIYVFFWVLPFNPHSLFVHLMPALHLGLQGAAWAMERPRAFPEGRGPNDLSLLCMFWCTRLVVSFIQEMEQNPMIGNHYSIS